MDFAILGGFGPQPLEPGWTKETALAFLGGGEFDLTKSPPGPDAKLRFYAFLGGVKIRVAPGTRVRMGGFSLLGGRKVEVKPGDGPAFHVTAVTILGGVEVTEAKEAKKEAKIEVAA